MKKIITLAVLALALQTAFAAYNGLSILNLRLNDNSIFKVKIDGQPQGRPSNTATLRDVPAGEHFLQIHTMQRIRGGREVSTLAYSGYIFVTPNTESFVTVFPEARKIKFDRTIALNNGNGRALPGGGRPGNGYKPPMVECPAPAPVVPMAMNAYDFSMLKQTISKASFENSKLAIFKQAMPYNNFTTQQVCEIMNLFWFESTKLEVAKAAYIKTIDRQNYYRVNNEFTFSSSIRELSDYLAMI